MACILTPGIPLLGCCPQTTPIFKMAYAQATLHGLWHAPSCRFYMVTGQTNPCVFVQPQNNFDFATLVDLDPIVTALINRVNNFDFSTVQRGLVYDYCTDISQDGIAPIGLPLRVQTSILASQYSIALSANRILKSFTNGYSTDYTVSHCDFSVSPAIHTVYPPAGYVVIDFPAPPLVDQAAVLAITTL